jgi:hypothetical protein
MTARRLGVVAGVAVVVTAIVFLATQGSKPVAHAHLAAWKTMPAVQATFLHDSYRPGETASLVLWHPEKRFTMRLFRVAPRGYGWQRTTMQGTAVSPVYRFGATEAHTPVRVRVGNWQSGVYFARLESDGLVGFAPFIVRPQHLGEHKVLIVEPTFTWQAYNFRDDNGDGRGDTWYDGGNIRTVRLDRPFLARGVPPHFTVYDLPFLAWLAQTGKTTDFISDSDLNLAGARALRKAYTLVIFPGHHEYVTANEYNAVTGYRNLGGHLMFLCANDFFWRVVRHGDMITRTSQWRTLGRPEASVIGVQYTRNNRGSTQGPWRVVTMTRYPWLFAGTGLKVGAPFGTGGVEIDHTAPSSPAGTTVVAQIPDLMGHGYTAQMTYYETPAGAEVFAAGAFTLAGDRDPVSHQVLSNLWQHLGPQSTA